jgi:hypothetical protein
MVRAAGSKSESMAKNNPMGGFEYFLFSFPHDRL